MNGSNSAMGKEEAEKEFRDVLYPVRHVLREIKEPLSVSYLNSTFACTFRRKSAITEDFMTQFKDEFMFWTIGNDVKIQLKGDSNPPELILVGYQAEANELKKILSKDLDKAKSIKEKMLLTRSMSFKNCCDKFSSRKHVVSYPFIHRNSHIFKLKAADGETSVEIVEDDNVVVRESEFWAIVQSEGFKKVVLRNVLNFFREFYVELNQGKLQVCFNYGRNNVIDKTFMAENSQYFEKTANGSMLFKLKEKYRDSEEFLVATTIITSTKNKDEDISKQVLNEVKSQNSVDEETSVEKIKAKVSSSVMSTESTSNSDNEFDACADSGRENSSLEGEDENMNEPSKRANKLSVYTTENIKEETKNQRSVSERCENENTGGTSNKNDASSCPPNSELREHSQTDETQKIEEEKKDEEEESSTMKQITKALEENRSFIFVGTSDKEPVLIGERRGSTEGKKEIKKINNFLSKLKEPDESLVETTTATLTKDKDISKTVLKEAKKQSPDDEGDESEAKVEIPITNRESKSDSGNESEQYSDTEFGSSSSEAEHIEMNESSRRTNKLSWHKAENIQEKTQNHRSVSEKCENRNASRTSNKTDTNSCPLNSELEDHAQTDEKQKTEEKKNAGEEESSIMTKIRKALEENRSFVFVGASDKDPVLIGERTGSNEEKISIKKINHCLIGEL